MCNCRFPHQFSHEHNRWHVEYFVDQMCHLEEESHRNGFHRLRESHYFDHHHSNDHCSLHSDKFLKLLSKDFVDSNDDDDDDLNEEMLMSKSKVVIRIGKDCLHWINTDDWTATFSSANAVSDRLVCRADGEINPFISFSSGTSLK